MSVLLDKAALSTSNGNSIT